MADAWLKKGLSPPAAIPSLLCLTRKPHLMLNVNCSRIHPAIRRNERSVKHRTRWEHRFLSQSPWSFREAATTSNSRKSRFQHVDGGGATHAPRRPRETRIEETRERGPHNLSATSVGSLLCTLSWDNLSGRQLLVISIPHARRPEELTSVPSNSRSVLERGSSSPCKLPSSLPIRRPPPVSQSLCLLCCFLSPSLFPSRCLQCTET